MRLKANIPSVEIDGESVMIFAPESEGFRGMLRSNAAAQFIIECLKTDTDEDGILSKLLEEFDGSEAEMREDIELVLSNLRQAGALEE